MMLFVFLMFEEKMNNMLIYYNLLMIASRMLLFKRLSMTPLARFSNGRWKEREETAENLYINQTESTSPII